MPQQAQLQFRASLLQTLSQEKARDVRSAMAELVASTAKYNANWPDLWKFIVAATGAAGDAGVREMAFRVLQAMGDTAGKMLKENWPQIQPLIRQGLADAENSVRVRALRVVVSLVPVLETPKEVALLRPLVEPAVKVIGYCVENNFTSDAIDTLDLFNDFVQEPEMESVLDGYMQNLFQFMIGLVRAPHLDLHLRDVALTFIQNVASLRTKQFLKQKWLQPTLECVRSLVAEPLDPEADDDDITAQRVAIGCVDILCVAVPEKYIGPAVLALCMELQRSPNWLERKACLEVLSTASQGCFIFMRDHLNDYLPALKAGFADPQIEVRQSACITLAHFCEQLGDPLMERHAELVPLLGNAMQDKPSVAMRALYALQFFSEQLGESFLQYSDNFMTAALTLITSGLPDVKDTAIGAVGSIAVALGPSFAKYLGPVVHMLRSFMSMTADEQLKIRARATEVAGAIANAVKRRVLTEPVLQEFNQLAFDGLLITSDLHQVYLRTAIYQYFANIADVMEGDFVPLLKALYPYIMATIESQEGIVGHMANDSSGLASIVDDDDDDEEGQDPSGMPVSLSVHQPIIEEKRSAIILVGSLALAMGKHMAMYVEKFLPKIIELLDYLHPDVRATAVKALPSMIHVVSDAFPSPGGPKFERGKFSNERPLSKQLMMLLPAVITSICAIIEEDRNDEAVVCAVEALEAIFTELGPAALEPQIQDIIKALLMVFDKQTFSQTLREQFDEDERDLELFNASVDLVSTMTKISGPTQFGLEIFKVFFPKMRAMYGPEQPDAHRALSLGALAEFCVHTEVMAEQFAEPCLKMALSGPASEDVVVRRNSVYLMGAAVQFGGARVAAAVPQVLAKIQDFLKCDDAAGVDNALGAMGRLILTGNPNLPLVDMIKAIFEHLPLKMDMEPYGPLYSAIIKVLRSPAANLVQPYLQQATQVALYALVNDKQKLDARSKPAVEIFLRLLGMGESKQLVQQAISAMPEHKQLQLKQQMNF